MEVQEPKAEKSIQCKEIFTGNIIKVEKHRVKLIDGSESHREVVRHQGAVAVVPVFGDKIILVKQFRFPVNQFLLEIPAGKLEEGEEPELCAVRELKEETGYKAMKLTKLSEMYTSPGFSDEKIHIFLAEVIPDGEPEPDSGEFIEKIELSFQDIVKEILSGKILDGKTIAGVLMAEKHLNI
ncbi:ADP-ribose pyrophosphatase [Kosmotoga arenicorallina S304]|uniref:ADP-ribose pyrophosphatase n=1 Tax=Kosmotoga arenicorallina S304 TaxID=1453497 RepID=A0A176K214_9BACT|nr:NUDIX hydrolase [Kosmotoga arenicorallina]OAA31060.1 ADP-ribose pyrophosphatase [Kosmotoga arenicorallina S304]